MSNKLTLNEIIKRVELINPIKYDYSLAEYSSLSTKIKVLDHNNNEHLIRPDSLLLGNNLNLKSAINKEEFLISSFNKVHNDKFSYKNLIYNSCDRKVTITCVIHGDFKQTIDNHKKGKGCPKCNGKNKTTLDIITDFNKIHNGKYDYSKVNYIGIKNKVEISCPVHGIFTQSPEEHINGCGCPICKESRGERTIRIFLEENKIRFIQQHKFDMCRNILPLPFDFYLPDHNICIEFQGEQHYKPFKYFGGEPKFKLTMKRDKIKQTYCKENFINLIIIPFNKPIIEILKNQLHYLPAIISFILGMQIA
jgi:hypothetical protein